MMLSNIHGLHMLKKCQKHKRRLLELIKVKELNFKLKDSCLLKDKNDISYNQ
jgi:hypothetical protein